MGFVFVVFMILDFNGNLVVCFNSSWFNFGVIVFKDFLILLII